MNKLPDELDLSWAACQIKLTLGKVTLSYLGSSFPVELYTCSQCGQVYIPEELAIGKMHQVESALEDK